MIGNWIFARNLLPFAADGAFMAGDATYGHLDADAVALGVRDTDDDEDRWFAYSFRHAPRPLEMAFAINPGSHVVSVNVRGVNDNALTPEIEAQLQMLFGVCQDYHLVPYR